MKYFGGFFYNMIDIWHHNATGLWLFTTPVFIYAELVNKHTCTSLNVFSVSVSFFPWTNCTCIGKALLRRRKKKYSSRGYIINYKTVFKKEQFLLRTKLHWTQWEGDAVDTKSINIHFVKMDWCRVVK